jgi:hypothetical protein
MRKVGVELRSNNGNKVKRPIGWLWGFWRGCW